MAPPEREYDVVLEDGTHSVDRWLPVVKRDPTNSFWMAGAQNLADSDRVVVDRCYLEGAGPFISSYKTRFFASKAARKLAKRETKAAVKKRGIKHHDWKIV